MITSFSTNSRAASLPPSNIITHNALRHRVYGLCHHSGQTNMHRISISPESQMGDADSSQQSPTRQSSLIELNSTTPNNKNSTTTITTQNQLNGPQCSTIIPSEFTGNADDDSGYGHTPPNYNRQAVAGSNSSIVTSSTPISLDTLSNGCCSGFDSKDELLQVMTEDLFDWFIHMYPQLTRDLEVETFFERLADGVLLGYHAGELHRTLATQHSTFRKGDLRVGGLRATLPNLPPNYQTRGLGGSSATSGFIARDNVSNFIAWCRQLGLPDSVLFESEDLVCRKNVRNVAICLLELARLGGRLGMMVPELVQLEVEIDQEITGQSDLGAPYADETVPYLEGGQDSFTSSSSQTDANSQTLDDEVTFEDKAVGQGSKSQVDSRTGLDEKSKKDGRRGYRTNKSTKLRYNISKQRADLGASDTNQKTLDSSVKPKSEIQRPVVDMRSLDEIVRDLLSQCTCRQTFPMVRIGEGRYLFGDKSTQIFVRILRRHVMVRVGGGWDTLSHFLSKYDDCRKTQPVVQTSVATEHKISVPVNCQNKVKAICEPIDLKHVDYCLREIVKDTCPIDESSPIKGELRLTAVKKRSLLTQSANGGGLEAFDPDPVIRNILSVNDVTNVDQSDVGWLTCPGRFVEHTGLAFMQTPLEDSKTLTDSCEKAGQEGRLQAPEKRTQTTSTPSQQMLSRPRNNVPARQSRDRPTTVTLREKKDKPPANRLQQDKLFPLPRREDAGPWHKQSPGGAPSRIRRPSAPQIGFRLGLVKPIQKTNRTVSKLGTLQNSTGGPSNSTAAGQRSSIGLAGKDLKPQPAVNTETFRLGTQPVAVQRWPLIGDGGSSPAEPGGDGGDKVTPSRNGRLPSLIPVPVRSRSLSRTPVSAVQGT